MRIQVVVARARGYHRAVRVRAIAVAILIVGCTRSQGEGEIDAGLADAVEMTPPAGLVSWFKLDGFGDSSGHGFQIGVGGPLLDFFADGYHGAGCHLNGTSQYGVVAVGAGTANLDFKDGFTLAMWVRPERVPADFEVIASRAWGDASESSFALAIDSTLRLRYDSQGGASIVGATPLELGRWAYVALTFDGAMKRLFLDGVLDASGPPAVPVTWDHYYVLFGAREEPTVFDEGHHLRAALDDIMLFDRALDASELAALAVQ